MDRPLLLVDVDGVISLFGFDPAEPPPGRFEIVDGIPHFLSADAGRHLQQLAERFDLAWCSGWEEKANEYLPFALGLPAPLPFVSFGDAPRTPQGHWKLTAIDSCVRSDRPLAWIDDAHDECCEAWAATRSGPTLLVGTDATRGLEPYHVDRLMSWAGSPRATG